MHNRVSVDDVIASATPLLDEQICFALYNASRALTARYRDLLEPMGLTYPQYLVLLVLWESGTATVSQIGERLHLESGTLSPLLRRLDAGGTIRRTRMPHDERSVQVSLTERGDRLRAEAAGIPEQLCAATGLRVEDLVALTGQLTQLADHARPTR